jgi:hypothetical protein
MIVTFSCIVRFQKANLRLLLKTSNVTFKVLKNFENLIKSPVSM